MNSMPHNTFFIYNRCEESPLLGVDIIRNEPSHPRAQRRESHRFTKKNNKYNRSNKRKRK